MVMQTQPSAQGIASLYMGNPDALQQRIQKEQQAKPGLPPDLKELMALDIVTNVEDAAKRQQAMNALNQMAPAGQEPPTVAQSVQAQAKQKLQAQMLQQQRQQMAMQELAKQGGIADGIPENVSQPETQPQGIDEIPVDMEFAGGGIVAFAKGDTTKPEPTEEELEAQRREDAEKIERLRNFLGEKFGTAGAGLTDAAIKAVAAGADIGTMIPRGLAGAIDTALIRPARALGADVGYLSPALTPGPQSPDTMTPFYDRYIRAREERKEEETPAPAKSPDKTREYMDRAGPMTAPRFVDPRIVQAAAQERPIADLKAAVEQRAPRPAPGPRPAPAVSDTYPDESMRGAAANLQSAPAGLDALYAKNLQDRMSLDPAARAEQLRKRHEEMVGAPDTSQYDRYMADLEARRKQFEAPKEGFDAFMELMSQIAAQGPQRTSAEAGARGAAALTALNKERQAQQFDLTKQMVDVAQKKLETERGFKKDLFTLTEKERDDIDKQVQDATKEYGLSKRDAEKYKRDLELEEIRRKNALALEGVRAKNQLAAKGRDYTAELIDAMQRNDTAAIKRITDSLEITKGAGRPDPFTKDPMYAKLAEEYAKLVAEAAKLPVGNKLRTEREAQAKVIAGQLDKMAGRTPAAPVESAPKPGDVQDGYKFLGGNPADPKNWQKV